MVDATIKWLQAEYESIFDDGSGVMKVHRGKVHKYLGMSLDFSHKGQCHVTMYDYLDGIREAFDAAVEKHGDGFIPVTKPTARGGCTEIVITPPESTIATTAPSRATTTIIWSSTFPKQFFNIK